MSVQLKPGQLISVQRTPSIHHLAHCVLNAPHHVSAHALHHRHFVNRLRQAPFLHHSAALFPPGRSPSSSSYGLHADPSPAAKSCSPSAEATNSEGDFLVTSLYLPFLAFSCSLCGLRALFRSSHRHSQQPFCGIIFRLCRSSFHSHSLIRSSPTTWTA